MEEKVTRRVENFSNSFLEDIYEHLCLNYRGQRYYIRPRPRNDNYALHDLYQSGLYRLELYECDGKSFAFDFATPDIFVSRWSNQNHWMAFHPGAKIEHTSSCPIMAAIMVLAEVKR